ncbi:hypothetical protein FHT15_002927 [Xanthomonas campestris]
MSPSADSAPATGRRRAALIFIFITVLIDVLSFGVIIPVLPDLVRQFTGGDYAVAAGWIGWFGFLFAAAGHPVRPLRPPSGDPALVPGVGPGFHPDGGCPFPADAAAGAGDLRGVLGQLLHR